MVHARAMTWPLKTWPNRQAGYTRGPARTDAARYRLRARRASSTLREWNARCAPRFARSLSSGRPCKSIRSSSGARETCESWWTPPDCCPTMRHPSVPERVRECDLPRAFSSRFKVRARLRARCAAAAARVPPSRWPISYRWFTGDKFGEIVGNKS